MSWQFKQLVWDSCRYNTIVYLRILSQSEVSVVINGIKIGEKFDINEVIHYSIKILLYYDY